MLLKLLKAIETFLKLLLSKSPGGQSSLPSSPIDQPSTPSLPLKKWKDKKLAIIVGHEKSSPGAYAKAPLNVYEYEFNKGVASIMSKYATSLGIECKVYFRDGIGISGIALAVNKWNPDCAIELHFNSATPAAIGTETLYDDFPAENKKLATIIQSHMAASLKRSGKGNRGIKRIVSGDRGHYNLSSIKVPGVLTEPFFGSNEADCALMHKSVNEYARALVNGVVEFLHSKQEEK